MRRPLDQPLLVILLGLSGLAMAVPALHAAALGHHAVARGFFYPGLLILLLVLLMALALQGYRPANVARSHLLQFASAYLLCPLALALPLLRLIPDLSLTAAWFEMVSALTTTGASTLDAAALAPSLHLWRALVGWMGGLLTLVAAVAILAPMNLGGFEVMSGRGAGQGAGGALRGKANTQQSQIARIADPSERMKRYSAQILPAYAGLTLLLWLGLMLTGQGGLGGFILALSTLSSSGITNGQAPASLFGEAMIFLCFTFATSRHALPGARARMAHVPLYQDPEFRLAISILLVATLALFTYQASAATLLAGAPAAFWGLLFTSASFLTGNGLVSSAWQTGADWSGLPVPGLVLAALALAGGGAATTAGGIKLVRLLVLYDHARAGMEHLLYPHSVGTSGRLARSLRERSAMVAFAFTILLLASIAITMAALTLTDIGFEPALVLSIAAISNTGPLAAVGGTLPLDWPIASAPQIVLALAMILGRLEILAVVMLLAPSAWRR